MLPTPNPPEPRALKRGSHQMRWPWFAVRLKSRAAA